MRVAVISDHDEMAAKIRATLLAHGNDVAARPVPLVRAGTLANEENLDLVILVLSPNVAQGMKALAELHLVCRARVLVVGPTGNAHQVLQAIHAGALDFIDEAALEADLIESLGRLHIATPSHSREAGKIIGVLAPSGGSGSSTVCVNLATVLAQEHKKCLIVDLKLQAGDLAALLDVHPTYTLAEICQNAGRMDQVMFERSLVGLPSGVELLASPQHFTDAAAVTPEAIQQVLNFSRSLFPYVVLDLDHSFQPEQLEALRMTDLLLLILRLDFISLRNLRRVLDFLGTWGMPDNKLRVVVNRFGQASEVPVPTVEEALGRKVFDFLPDDPRTANEAINNGVPLVLEKPSTRLARSLVQLAHHVNGRVIR